MTKDEATARALEIIGLVEVPFLEKRRGRRGLSDTQIIEAVREGASTLAELAFRLGVTEAAVSVRARHLHRSGLLTRTFEKSGTRGRPSVRYALPAEGQ